MRLPHLPYRGFARKLFPSDGQQQIIPFLGAGVSISARDVETAGPPQAAYPSAAELDAMADALQLRDSARVLFRMAAMLASALNAAEPQLAALLGELRQKLEASRFPPSSGEIAWLCSKEANYTTLPDVAASLLNLLPADRRDSEAALSRSLELLALLTSVASPPDALSAITAYFEATLGRADLWRTLHEVISTKTQPTPTHQLFAEAAAHALANRAREYLIITTNYDVLMERALDLLHVPYAVLTTKLEQLGETDVELKTVTRFSPDVADRERLQAAHPAVAAANFTLQVEQPMALVYKIHGCLDPSLTIRDDGVVISDDDYVKFISQKDPIPAHVTNLLNVGPFLFLGYSLNDWNIRSIFIAVKRKRAARHEMRDLCVNLKVRKFEEVFFDKHDVNIYEANLNDFVLEVRRGR